MLRRPIETTPFIGKWRIHALPEPALAQVPCIKSGKAYDAGDRGLRLRGILIGYHAFPFINEHTDALSEVSRLDKIRVTFEVREGEL